MARLIVLSTYRHGPASKNLSLADDNALKIEKLTSPWQASTEGATSSLRFTRSCCYEHRGQGHFLEWMLDHVVFYGLFSIQIYSNQVMCSIKARPCQSITLPSQPQGLHQLTEFLCVGWSIKRRQLSVRRIHNLFISLILGKIVNQKTRTNNQITDKESSRQFQELKLKDFSDISTCLCGRTVY